MNTRFLLPTVAVLVLSVVPAPAATPAQAQNLVKKAILYANQNSMDKLIQETNQADGRFHVGTGGELYIFIYSTDGVCKAIGFETQQAVGKNRMELKDPDGKLYIKDFITLAKTQGSGWVDYKKPNPSNGKIEAKTSYVEMCQGLVIGAGAYKE